MESSDGDRTSPEWMRDEDAKPIREAASSDRPDDGVTVAGSSMVDGVPEAVEDVVAVEGAARESVHAPGALRIHLFHADEPVCEIGLEQVPSLVANEANFVWVDLSEFGERDLRRVADILSLNTTSLRSALSPWQRPRLDVYDGSFFVTATIPRSDSEAYRVYAAELDLFVYSNFLVSAHKLPLPFYDRAMARAGQDPERMQQDSSFLLYILLDELLDYYEGLVEEMGDQIERMEERALTDTSDTILGDLQHLKRYVYAVVRIAGQHREVFAAFTRPDFPFSSREEIDPYFRELEDRLAQLFDELDTARDDVNGAFDIYVSHVSHRMNQVMQLLTVVSVTLLPTTIILGFWGTNFQGVPLYTTFGFLAMMMVIAATTLVVLYVFHRKKWL